MGGFPGVELRPDGGRLYSWIFENESVGLKRGHFWSFTIDFKPFLYKGESVKPSMTVEWVTLPIRRWQELKGTKIHGAYGDGGVEASFYVWEHDCASDFRLEAMEREQERFRIRMGMTVEFSGWDGTDSNPKLPVEAECWIPYEGLSVPEDLEKEAISPARARELAEAFADMKEYGAPNKGSRDFPSKIS